tara:strand:+ start:276 stop:590 length:315 start_codon:yes stop_codon:yes gene_type:complete
MSLITYIDGIPVYTTIKESMSWASQYNLPGYHEHIIGGRLGYMGGSSHQQITQAIRAKAEGVLQQPPPLPRVVASRSQTTRRVTPVVRQVRSVTPPPSNTSSGY